jgi:hypothetical protein
MKSLTNLEYIFCPRPNLTSGICQANANSDVVIDCGSTVVVIHTQLAELIVATFDTFDSISVNRPSSDRSNQISLPSVSDSVLKFFRVVMILFD